MKTFTGDVDIDVANRSHLLAHIDYVDASIMKNGKAEKHKVGIYVQDVPCNPVTNLSNIDYKVAHEFGYQKIDILNVSMYEDIRDREHLMRLINTEPVWELLTYKEIVSQLFHISEYFELVSKLKPDTVEKLAATLAIIRPGKKHLANSNWDEILKTVWDKPDNGEYYYKRSHAISYAVAIIVQLNLITEQS